MTKIIGIISFCVLFLAACNHIKNKPEMMVVLSEGKEAKAVIVIGSSGSAQAANELKAYLDQAGDAEFPVISESELSSQPDSMIKIIVGDGEKAKELGEDSTTYEIEEMRAIFKENFILINGRNIYPRNGTMWAVNEFLDQKLKVRFLWPGKIGTHIPYHENIVIHEGDIKRIPPLLRRDMRQSRLSSLDVSSWSEQHQLSTIRTPSGLTWNHAFQDWWDKYGKTKSYLFAVDPQGRISSHSDRTRLKFNIGDPRVVEQIKEEYIAKGMPNFFNVSPTDSSGYDTSEASMALDPIDYSPRDVWNGNVDLTDRHVKHWNAILKALREVNPNVELSTYAYGPYRNPPQTVSLESGAFHISYVATWYESDKEIWNEWAEQAEAMYLRPNWPFNGGSAPYFPLHDIGGFLEHAYMNKMAGFDLDSLNGYFGTRGIFYYLLVRKSSHPEISTDDILEEFYEGFGPAKEQMKTYYEFWEQYSDALRMPVTAGGPTGGDPNGPYMSTLRREKLPTPNPLSGSWHAMPFLYAEPKIQEGLAHLDKALEQVEEGSIFEERIQMIKDSFDLFRIQRSIMENVNPYCFGGLPAKDKQVFFKEIKRLTESYYQKKHELNAVYGDIAHGGAMVQWVDKCGKNLKGL
jgi:hypothetical protein